MTTATNNHHPLPPRDDREALSALFDGELPGDSARFALKRLDHDAQWRDTCGRWQLIGDTLRGEAVGAAHAGFADGVMRALAADAQAAAAVPAQTAERTARRMHRRWLGGAALAATVAVATVLAVRPYSQPEPAAQVAAEVASPAPAIAATSDVPAATAQAGESGPVVAVAVADAVPATASQRRAARPAIRLVRTPAATTAATAEQPATALAAAAQAANRQPFHPPADDIVARPWPRSVLSEAGAAGALTVGFGTGTTTSPSLYPFEPRLQPESQTTRPPQPVEPQR
ncbi:sigma-E factor negative regulatory protein [Lysobacter solisilvae (ex Woo and Kim 2020)]|uniref:Sigma-E factor negative regulatory protein n=1 Tax=Agrilutibacter terrestris TaxID=2865112 RepID=A0A7H0FY90_9GAMM|nr:sigma-E factor negative regulatory protein [Lysobacter terrestris]QNP41006.1 sigma-E factor negative regulatory protein [Lysobacter terrestris]